MDDNLYAWKGFDPTANVNLQTLYSHDESKSFGPTDIANMAMSPFNVNTLCDLIIERADPLRTGSSLVAPETIRPRIVKLLESWKNIGKFDKDTIPFEGKILRIRAVSPAALLDHYNLEFVKAFAETILPISDATKVTSVVNPNGLYAQQQRILKINSKPTPFYQKAPFRRLHDRKLDQRIDETESFFYKMDHNPRMLDSERKKRDVDTSDRASYLDREGLSYRMKPKY